LSEAGLSYYDRTHALRKCREMCAEYGFSGTSFHRCVESCVKRLKEGKTL